MPMNTTNFSMPLDILFMIMARADALASCTTDTSDTTSLISSTRSECSLRTAPFLMRMLEGLSHHQLVRPPRRWHRTRLTTEYQHQHSILHHQLQMLAQLLSLALALAFSPCSSLAFAVGFPPPPVSRRSSVSITLELALVTKRAFSVFLPLMTRKIRTTAVAVGT